MNAAPQSEVLQNLLEARARIDAAIAALGYVEPDPVAQTLGQMIASHRALLNLSLQQLADRVSVSKAHLWEMEQGRASNPTASLIVRLSRALNVSPATLIGAAA